MKHFSSVLIMIIFLGLSKCAMTPLMKASARGDRARVESLIKEGADVNEIMGLGINGIDYPSALAAAAAKGHKDIVKLLIDNGAKVDLTDSDGPTALMTAAYCGNAEIVKMLIDAGADVNLHGSVIHLWNCGCEGEAAWHGTGSGSGNSIGQAVRNGHADAVRILLASGAETGGIYRWYDGQQGTLTDMAIRNGYEDIARILQSESGRFDTRSSIRVSKNYSGVQELIAVMDFTAKDVSRNVAVNISELIRNELINQKRFTVIERSQMDMILKEQSFQQSGCTDVSCAVQVGKILSAKKILIGSVMKMGNKYYISGRIVDVEKGIGENAANQTANSLDDLDSAINSFVNKLSGLE